MNRLGMFITLILLAAGFSAHAHAQVPGTGFRDCDVCPDMVVIAPGTFIMGSPESESGRFATESPQHTVTLSRAIAVAKFEVTRGQFAVFVAETGYQSQGGNCWYWGGGEGKWVNDDTSKSWHAPGYTQSDGHPAVCVSWHDAKAYVSWLAQKTGKGYRLLSEAEWEYAARGGTTTVRPWGNDFSDRCAYANVADRSFTRIVPPGKGKQWNPGATECDDNAGYTAPVGSYRPNAFGLYDMIGNVWEWAEDCWNESYNGAPADGTAWLTGDCSRRVERGGGWNGNPRSTRSANRSGGGAAGRSDGRGFRVARAF